MKSIIRNLFLLTLFTSPLTLWAAETQQKVKPDALSNPYMLLMIVLIVVLLVVISVLNHTIVSVSEINRMAEKQKKSNNGGSATIIALLLLILPATGLAQEAAGAMAANVTETLPDDGLMFGMSKLTFYGLLIAIAFELIVILFQISIIKGFASTYAPKPVIKAKDIPQPVKESTFWKKVNQSVAIEKEEDIMFDHEYDGIRELDNNLPPWWKYGFYVSILFAFVYLIHYHIAKSGPLQEQEYLTAVEEGKREVEEYLKNAADNVDENSVKMLTAPADITAGKTVYDQNCVACHGALGEGKVGPNLTDDYWIHSGSIKDIFVSIKYGWADKGMKSWKDDLTPKQIAQVSSFLKTLKGTNPPNALPPKGDKYEEKK